MFLFSFQVKSQKEIARFDYMMLDDVGNTSISDLNVGLQYDVLKNSNVLTLYFEYLKRDFDFFDVQGLLSIEEIERLHQLEIGVGYTMGLGTSYEAEVVLNPTISTTWATSLSNDDLLWNFSATISKTWYSDGQDIRKLRIGILRNALFGSPSIVPTLTYQMAWSDQWFLNLGFPNNSITYRINERNKIGLNHTFTGTYTNISSPLILEDFGEVEEAKFVQNATQLALNYSYRLQPNFTTTTRIGYQFVNEFEVQDVSENLLHDFGGDTSIYFSIGIQYNFK